MKKEFLLLVMFFLILYYTNSSSRYSKTKLKKTYYKVKLENNPNTFENFYILDTMKKEKKQSNVDWLGIYNNDLELDNTINKFKKFLQDKSLNILDGSDELFKPVDIIIQHQEVKNIISIEKKDELNSKTVQKQNKINKKTLLINENICHYTLNYKLNFSEYNSYITNHLIVRSLNNEQSLPDLLSQNHCLILKSIKFSKDRIDDDVYLCSDKLVYFLDFLNYITNKMFTCKAHFFKTIKQEKIFNLNHIKNEETRIINTLNQLSIGSFKAYVIKIESDDLPEQDDFFYNKITVNGNQIQLTENNDNENKVEKIVTSWKINNIVLAHYIKTEINLYKQIIIEYDDLEITFKDVVLSSSENKNSNCFGFYYLINKEVLNDYLNGETIKNSDIPLYSFCFPSKIECDHARKIIKYAVILYHFVKQEKLLIQNAMDNYYDAIEKDISDFTEKLINLNKLNIKDSIFNNISKLKEDLLKNNNSKANKDTVLKLYWEFHKSWMKNDFDSLVFIANKIHNINLTLDNYGLIE
jgi:hypothetical protein